MIVSKQIINNLTTRFVGKKIFTFETIDSTNTCARLLAECGTEEGTVVVAEYQISGKGRINREWISAKGKNLLFSIIFSPKVEGKHLSLFPLLMSVAVVEGIKENCPECSLRVKWPNDILLDNGKKIAGILMKLTRTYNNEPRIIAGIGLNVNQRSFPAELKSKASSLKIATGKTIDRIKLFQKILESIERWYVLYPENTDELINTWRNYCDHLGKQIQIHQPDKLISGLCLDIDRDGALIIENGNKQRTRIFAGDIIT